MMGYINGTSLKSHLAALLRWHYIALLSDLTYTHSRSILGITTLALITLGPRKAFATNAVAIDVAVDGSVT